MTIDEVRTLGIPLSSYDDIDVLYVESALKWLSAHTTLEIDITDLEKLKALPSGAKLFIMKYREIMGLPLGVTSESIDGLSQSFSDTLKKDKLLEYANELLCEYMKPAISFTPAVRKWDFRGC